MTYSTRHIPGQSIFNTIDADTHEKVDVSVFSIDGCLVAKLNRTVFIDQKGERVVRLLGKERKLRAKKGTRDAVVLNIEEAEQFRQKSKKPKKLTSEGSTMKIRYGRLKRMILESLVEADEEPTLDPSPAIEPDEEGEDSLDDQVDKYFGEYESEAKSSKTEGKDFRRTLRRLLGEAADDADPPEETPDDGPGLDADPSKQPVDSIDVASFVNSVVRLIDNYDSLLEVRNTILRRAATFLGKTYDPKVVEAFKDDLRENHGMEIGKSHDDTAQDEFPAPAADRAGDGGSGPGGGGAP